MNSKISSHLALFKTVAASLSVIDINYLNVGIKSKPFVISSFTSFSYTNIRRFILCCYLSQMVRWLAFPNRNIEIMLKFKFQCWMLPFFLFVQSMHKAQVVPKFWYISVEVWNRSIDVSFIYWALFRPDALHTIYGESMNNNYSNTRI